MAALRPVEHYVAPLHRRATFHPALSGREGDEHSQFGEDGLIEALFEVIGTTNKWCFEVGAADGIFYSNTKRLRDAGWESVLIESAPHQYAKLIHNAGPLGHTVQARVSSDVPIDDLLAQFNAPFALDFGVIDIDGQDYWVWEDMERYKPRVMLVEFSPHQVESFIPDRDAPRGQAGLQAILDMGESKGYRKAAVSVVNVLFVRNELWTD